MTRREPTISTKHSAATRRHVEAMKLHAHVVACHPRTLGLDADQHRGVHATGLVPPGGVHPVGYLGTDPDFREDA